MKIVADANIPEVAAAFADLGDVCLLPGREIRPSHLRDCRCLLVRTVTRVDEDLLRDTAVEFVATATIGTDHVDQAYLARSGIGFSNAPGCNAESAAEYVISGLFALSRRNDFDPFTARVGIVGLGNVGGRLAQILQILGIECLACDPPLAARDAGEQAFVDLDTLIGECNIISLHTPLTRVGAHATYHLFDHARLQSLQPGCLLINAARGEVIDNCALLKCLARQELQIFLDTWENEPAVSTALLERVDLATPHIAGYSCEGRLRGTQMVLDAASHHFGLKSSWHMTDRLPEKRELKLAASLTGLEFWQGLFAAHFDIWRDHEAFVTGLELTETKRADHFDRLRRVFEDRLEYPRWSVRSETAEQYANQLQRLGFHLPE